MRGQKYLRNHTSPKCLHDGCWPLPSNPMKDFGNYKSLQCLPKKLLTFGALFGSVEVMEGRTAGQAGHGTQPAVQVPLSRMAVYGGSL
jgi:hypothetical protein